MSCPNIKSSEFKKTESLIGKKNTYKLFMLTNDYVLDIQENDSPNTAIQKLKLKYNSNEFGNISDSNYQDLVNEINSYNSTNDRISIDQKEDGTYKLGIKGNIISKPNSNLQVQKNPLNTVERIQNNRPLRLPAEKLGFNQEFQEPHSKINFILGKIINQGNCSEEYKFLASFIKGLPNEFKDGHVRVVEGLKRQKGRDAEFGETSHRISVDDSLSEQEMITAFLHEMLHMLTSDVLKNPRTEKQKEIKRALEVLRQNVKSYYEQQLGFEITEDNIKKNLDDLRPYYGLINIDEFISELFTNKSFQRLLSNSAFSESKSFLQRIAELLRELIEDISGFKFNKDSNLVLDSAINNSLRLISDITSVPIGMNISENTLGSLSIIIKEGVKEIFEENKELANIGTPKQYSQYLDSLNKPNTNPILQGNQNPDVILPIGTSGSGKSTFIKSLPQENLVVIEPDAMRVEFTGNMNDKSKDKEIYIEAAKRAIKAIKQGKQVVFDTTNLTKDKRLPFIEAIKKEIPNANIQYKLMELNPELAKQRIKAQLERGENRANVSDETIDRHAISYKQMLEDIKSEPISNYDIQQEQVKKFAELQERLNNKEFLEGAKNAFENSKELQNVYYEAAGVSKQINEIADTKKVNDFIKKYKEALPNIKNGKTLISHLQTISNRNTGTTKQFADLIIKLSQQNKSLEKLLNNPNLYAKPDGVGDEGAFHWSLFNNLSVNKIVLELNHFKTNTYDDVFLHELIHNLTTQFIVKDSDLFNQGFYNKVKELYSVFDNHLENNRKVNEPLLKSTKEDVKNIKRLIEYFNFLPSDAIQQELIFGKIGSISTIKDVKLDFKSLENKSKEDILQEVNTLLRFKENRIKEIEKGDKDYYYFNSKTFKQEIVLSEFLATFMNNAEFREQLKNIEYKNNKSLFQKVIDLIGEFLGLTKNESLYNEFVLNLTKFINDNDYSSVAKQTVKTAYENRINLLEQQKQQALDAYTDFIARVSLGIIKNPSSGDYNYTSQVKDIVYHHSSKKLENFDKSFLGSETNAPDTQLGFFFAENKNDIPNMVLEKNEQLKQIGSDKILNFSIQNNILLNIKNPEYYHGFIEEAISNVLGREALIISKTAKEDYKEARKKLELQGKDSLIYGLTVDFDEEHHAHITHGYVVFEPEQIHILGSKQDIKGFKEFVQGKQFQKLTAEEKAKTIEQVTKEHRSITALKDLSAKLAHRIGGKVEFENKSDVDWKGYNQGNTSVLNEAYMTSDTPFHEILAHPIIRAIKNKDFTIPSYVYVENSKNTLIKNSKDVFTVRGAKNSEEFGTKSFNTKEEAQKYADKLNQARKTTTTLYQSLLKELETGRGKEVFEQVKRDYKYKITAELITDRFGRYGIKEGNSEEFTFDTKEEAEEQVRKINSKEYTLEEQQEEAIVTLLGLMAADKLDAKKDATLISKLKELWKQISDFIKSLLRQDGIKIDELPITTTLNDLAEIMAYGNNKIILPGYKVEYSTPLGNKYDTLEEVNNEIKGLADANVEVDLSGVKIEKHTGVRIPAFIKTFERNENGVKVIYSRLNEQWKKHIEGEYEQTKITIDEANKAYSTATSLDNYVQQFIEKNKEYEQSKEIIEQWKKENNIQYDPEEVYSRGHQFISTMGAFGKVDLELLFQNMLQHLEDYDRIGAKFELSFHTAPIDNRQVVDINRGGGKVYVVAYPQSNDIAWASKRDNSSGSVWEANKKVSDKPSEIAGVAHTKAPSIDNIDTIEPNLATIIDGRNWARNELGIAVTTTNHRVEYDESVPYEIKKLIDNYNKILDDKYGKLEKPEIKTPKKSKYVEEILALFDAQVKASSQKIVINGITKPNKFLLEGYSGKLFNTIEEAEKYRQEQLRELRSRISNDLDISLPFTPKKEDYKNLIGKQPTQTKENTTSIDSVREDIVGEVQNTLTSEDVQFELNDSLWVLRGTTKYPKFINVWKKGSGEITKEDYINFEDLPKKAQEFFKDKIQPLNREYTQQAETNLKIAALKEVARKYPRSLITSKVVPINPNMVNSNEIQYSKVGSKQDIEGFKEFVKNISENTKGSLSDRNLLQDHNDFDNIVLDYDGTLVDTNSAIQKELGITPKEYYFSDFKATEEQVKKVTLNSKLTSLGKELLNLVKSGKLNPNKIIIVTAGNNRYSHIKQLLGFDFTLINTQNQDIKDKYKLSGVVAKDKAKIIENIKGRNLFIDDNTTTSQYVKHTTKTIVRDVVKPKTGSSLKDSKKLLNEFQKDLLNRKNKLEESLHKEKNIKRKESLSKRIEVLKDQLTQLTNNNHYTTIVEIATENLAYVKQLMSKPNLTDSDIIEVQNFIALYKDTIKYLDDDFKFTNELDENGIITQYKTDIFNSFGEIENEAKRLDSKVFDIECDFLLNQYEKLFGTSITKEDLYKITKDVGDIENNFRSAGSFGVKLLEMQEVIIRLANNRANDKRTEIVKQNNTLFEKVKQNALFIEKGFSALLDKDENGKWNGKVLTKFNKKYWSTYYNIFKGTKSKKGLTELLNKKTRTDSENQQIEEHFDSYNNNHYIIDYTKLEDNKYKEEIIKRFGIVHGNNLLNQAETKYSKYLSDRQGYIDYLDSNFPNPEQRDKKLYDWEIYHSPIRLMQTLQGDRQLTSYGLLPKSYHWGYLTSTPLEQHFNEDYNVLEQPENVDLLNYLNFANDVLGDLRNLAPDKLFEKEGFTLNSLPIIAKDLMQKYAKDGMLSSFFSSTGDWLKSFIKHTQKENQKSKDEYTGKDSYNLELQGISKSSITEFNVSTGKHEVNRDKQSDNIFDILNYTAGTIALYQNKLDFEDSHKMIVRAMNHIGTEQYGHNANKDELKNVKSVADFYNKNYYGIANEVGGEVERKVYTKEENRKNKEINIRIQDITDLLNINLENKLDSKKGIEELGSKALILQQELELEDINTPLIKEKLALIKELNKLIEVKEGLGSNFSFGQTGRSILKWVQTKAMGFNLFSGINEVMFGMVTTFNYATGQEIYNEKDWGNAFGTMLRFRNGTEDVKKIHKLLEKFNLIKNSMVENIDSNPMNNTLFFLQKNAEAFTRGITMVSVLNSIKVKGVNGEELSLYNVLDSEGNIDKNLVSGDEYDKWTTGEITEWERLNIKIQTLVSSLHGNYDSDTPIKAKQSFWGMASLQFRTWLLEGIANRGQDEHFDSRLGLIVKGRYKTMNNSTAWIALLKRFAFINDKNNAELQSLSQVDKANIRKNATELIFLLTVSAAILALKHLGDDDEDDKEWTWTNLMLNNMLRLQQDLAFYINPNEVESLNSKIIPATVIMNDFAQLMDAYYDTVLGEGTYKTGMYSGESKAFKETLQFFPVTNQYYKFDYLARQTMDKIK